MTAVQKKRIAEIYKRYHETLKPLIVSVEVDDAEYPVEIMNEIRAIMNHLAKCYMVDDNPDLIKDDPELSVDKVIESNLGSAESHLKRAIFDGFKYECVSADDYYQAFCRKMKHVDLTVVDNGQFSSELSELYVKAKKALKAAKKRENAIVKTSDLDEVFHLFEDAYVAYDEVREHIDSSAKNTERARHRQSISRWITNGLAIYGVISGVEGVYSIASVAWNKICVAAGGLLALMTNASP